MSVINIKLKPGRWFTWEDVKVSKFTSCDDCFYKHDKSLCDKCVHSLVDNFSCLSKEKWKEKLFIGAPVMASTIVKGAEYEQFVFDGKLKFHVTDEIVRLPTPNEAPCNVWLCPWDEVPEVSVNKTIIVRTHQNVIVSADFQYCNFATWKEAVAIMILDDFKR